MTDLTDYAKNLLGRALCARVPALPSQVYLGLGGAGLVYVADGDDLHPLHRVDGVGVVQAHVEGPTVTDDGTVDLLGGHLEIPFRG